MALVTVFWSSTALAAGTSGGPLAPMFVTTNSNGVVQVYFQFTTTPTLAACATSVGGNFIRYAVNAATDGGKAQLALLMTAAAAGIQVWFQGAGTCTVDGTDEDLAQVHFNR
jgi:hypothetical protein